MRSAVAPPGQVSNKPKQQLAVQVADRQALARRRAEQRLVRRQAVHQPRVTLEHRFMRAIVEHQLLAQPQRLFVGRPVRVQLGGHHLEQAWLVDAHEVVADVQLQRVGRARTVGRGFAHELLQPLLRGAQPRQRTGCSNCRRSGCRRELEPLDCRCAAVVPRGESVRLGRPGAACLSSTRCQDSARTPYRTSSRRTAHKSTHFPRQGQPTSGGATGHRSRATRYGGLNQHAWAAQTAPQESRRGGRTMMKLGTLAGTGRPDCPARARPFRPPCPQTQAPACALPCVCLNQPSFCLATEPTCSTACR